MKSGQLSLLLLSAAAFALFADEPDMGAPGSVRNAMMTVVTPATDTIWGIEDPQTEAEWQVYIDAATNLIAAAEQIKSGGNGPSDSSWAESSEWQRFADALLESGRGIQVAARARDLDTLVNVSNDEMYPPCEECHAQFLPGAQQ